MATERFNVGKTDPKKPSAKTAMKKADSIDKKEPSATPPKRTDKTEVAPKNQGPSRAKAR